MPNHRLLKTCALLLFVAASCTQPKPPPKPEVDSSIVDESYPAPNSPHGPTTMSHVAEGYELRNRAIRVVISGKTGDVIYWGAINSTRNTLFRHGVYATLSTESESPISGYIEKRDDQTWQYFGEDSSGITWRKIYCLEEDSLLASFIILNTRPDPVTTAIDLRGDFPNLRILEHSPEQFTGQSAFGVVSLHGFNEFHSPTSQPALPILIESDTRTIKPQERMAFTTQWMLSQR